jgi:hypothetical protein
VGIETPTPSKPVVVDGGAEFPKLSSLSSRSAPPASTDPVTNAVVDPAESETAAALLAWLDAADLPTELFQLSPGVRVGLPERFYGSLRAALSRGPGGPRWPGALRDALRLKEIVDVRRQGAEVTE